jgi:hypothetical protein
MGILASIVARLRGDAREETAEEKHKRIVGEYVNACSRYAKQTLADLSVLPHPKEEIQAAMLWLMESNQTARQVFKPIYLGTSIYQRGVGSRDALELLGEAMTELELLKATLASKGIT